MKKVMVFGTFDILHPGHISFLKQAKKWGDNLIVVIARDKTVLAVKGRNPKNKEKTRLLTVKKSNLADKVTLGFLKDKYRIITKHRPEIICLGYDQKYFSKNLRQILTKRGLLNIKIKRLKPYRPKKYKSSILLKQHK